jgi:hypothetical protein
MEFLGWRNAKRDVRLRVLVLLTLVQSRTGLRHLWQHLHRSIAMLGFWRSNIARAQARVLWISPTSPSDGQITSVYPNRVKPLLKK